MRRINKHIHSPQDPEYNSTWSDKVQFFREEITKLIEKDRITSRTKGSIQGKYY